MARTIAEIKKSMTDKFMQDAILRNSYGISGSDATWDDTFSSVSIENILIHIVSVCAYSLETLFDLFKAEVNEQITQNVVPTVRWYHTQAVGFQYGDVLVYDEDAGRFCYGTVDETKRVVKYCAVKDRGGSIQMLVSGDAGGKPVVLQQGVMTAFRGYMNSVKVAGVILDVRSLEADSIRIAVTVQVDPQVIGVNGRRIDDGRLVVVEAVDAYLARIVYGGTFNKTRCVDAIQTVEGVVDVTLAWVKVKAASAVDYGEIVSNNYTAAAGCFISDGLDTSIVYVV